MTEFANVNEQRVINGNVTVPYYGAWSGDITLADGPTLPTGPRECAVTFGNLTLLGTVIRQSTFAGSTRARLVGGGGGWRKTIGAQHYQSPTGLTKSFLVGDAALAVDELLVVAPDGLYGTDYARSQDAALEVIRQVAGDAWWIDPAGVTHIGPRVVSPVPSPFQALEWDGGGGHFSIATEDYAAWLPGAQFIGPTITTPQTVSSCTFDVTNDGIFRLDVLSTDGSNVDRLISPIDAVVRASAPKMTYAQIYEYTVVGVSGSPPDVFLDVAPASSLALPTMRNIRLMPDAAGAVSVPSEGATCQVFFANGDPSKPRIFSVDATVIQAEMDAAALVRMLAPLVEVGAIPLPVSSAPATLTIITALETVVASVDALSTALSTMSSAIASTTAPGPPSPSFPAFASAVTGPAGAAATAATATAGVCTTAASVIAGAVPFVPTTVLEAE